MADTERRRSALIDLAADGTITRNDLRTKLAELDREREACHEEIRVLRESREELEALETGVGLPWAAAFALGAFVSPTDAIAATAIAQRLGVHAQAHLPHTAPVELAERVA